MLEQIRPKLSLFKIRKQAQLLVIEIRAANYDDLKKRARFCERA